MKVSVENIIAKCNFKGKPDLEEISEKLEGSRYQKDVMDGIIYRLDHPECDIFILGDGTVKIHGLTSTDDIEKVVNTFSERLDSSDLKMAMADGYDITEVVASTSVDKMNPRKIYETFQEDGIVYNPQELPGFILKMGKEGVTVLIFPEGKIVCKGAKNIEDAVSTLEMVVEALRE